MARGLKGKESWLGGLTKRKDAVKCFVSRRRVDVDGFFKNSGQIICVGACVDESGFRPKFRPSALKEALDKAEPKLELGNRFEN